MHPATFGFTSKGTVKKGVEINFQSSTINF